MKTILFITFITLAQSSFAFVCTTPMNSGPVFDGYRVEVIQADGEYSVQINKLDYYLNQDLGKYPLRRDGNTFLFKDKNNFISIKVDDGSRCIFKAGLAELNNEVVYKILRCEGKKCK